MISEGTRGQGFKGSSEMLKNYKSYGSVCELEIQILLAGDLGLIEKRVLGKLKKTLQKSKEC
jgi:hypothetical protein